MVGSEGGFPLIALLYLDIIETLADIQLCEVLGTMELGNEFWNKQKWVFILHSYGVQRKVVLYQTKLTILLLNKEDWRGHWRLGGADPTRIEVLLKEGVQLLLLRGREWVDLATFQRGVRNEFHCIILWFGLRQFVK